MLEYSSLWLSAPTTTWPPGLPPTGKWLRRVLAGEAREPIGHVAITPARWLPWPTGPRLAAYEGLDVSLLFTAKRIGWAWPVIAVAEADGNAVAWAYGRTLACGSRRFPIRPASADAWQSGTFANEAGAEIARWAPDGAGAAIHFADEVNSLPFVKMGLLAVILIQSQA